MRTPIMMPQKVQFWSFQDPRNQGYMTNLGEHEVYLERITTATFRSWCCASRELVTETKLTVKIDGRTFAVTEGNDVIDRSRNKFEVTLPYGFNPFKQKVCPTCDRPL